MTGERNGLPELECDLVMRGGITSGLVYPEAVAELSKKYRFRNIGGTSAGAIAAVATAAAEYGRQKIIASGHPQFANIPFDSVAKIPDELSERKGGRTKLLRLFQPQKRMRPLFRLAMALVGGAPRDDKKAPKKNKQSQGPQFEDQALAIGKAVVTAFPFSSILGALPGFVLGMSIIAGLTRRYWEALGAQQILASADIPSETPFGLRPILTLPWLSSSALAMALFVGLCVAAFWLSRRAIRATAALIFVVPVGLALILQFYAFLGLEDLRVDVFAQFSSLFGLVIAAFAAFVGALLASTIMMGRRAYTGLPANMYGICTGLSVRDAKGVPGITDWLHQFIQRVAGRTADEKPLTSGDLWKPAGYNGFRDITEEEREIELSLMITNVTRGISHRFPFLEGWRGSLYFKPSDFKKLFPHTVIEHMVRHAQAAEPDVTVDRGMFRLPAAKDLPIILGARMSMAFPFLLSAIPLYAVDWSGKGPDQKYRLKRCWFSDGGLTSNFPINLFDRPLPVRPTFGINLVPDTARHYEIALPQVTEGNTKKMNWEASDFESRATDAAEMIPGLEPNSAAQQANEPWDDIWMPRRNDQDLFKVIRFNDFEGEKGSVTGFFNALFDTARNWADTELAHMPGYRDRIVHVELKPEEGGLNLDMPDHVIRNIGEKGRLAGKLLAARFAPNPGMDPQWHEKIELTWENHRWLRYRSTMAALEHVARDLVASMREQTNMPSGVRSYQQLLEQSLETTSHYRWASREQYLFALEATSDLTRFIGQWMRDHETFDRVLGHHDPLSDGFSPRPKAAFQIVPPSDADPRNERVTRF